MPDEGNAAKDGAFKLKVKLRFPDNLQSVFATNFVVQHAPDAFTLSFFEAIVPPIVGESMEEQRKAFEAVGAIDGKCVSRVVLTPAKMIELVEILNKNLEIYKKQFSKK